MFLEHVLEAALALLHSIDRYIGEPGRPSAYGYKDIVIDDMSNELKVIGEFVAVL